MSTQLAPVPGRRVYAGIGSREAPPPVLVFFRRFADHMASRGWTLRSGRAPGSDLAFEVGAMMGATSDEEARARAEIMLPWPSFGSDEFRLVGGTLRMTPGHVLSSAQLDSLEPIIRPVSPAWDRLMPGVKRLHARNGLQILGADLAAQRPVEFVICWTPDGAISAAQRSRNTGGTGVGIALADRMGIPVINVAASGWKERMRDIASQLNGLAPGQTPGPEVDPTDTGSNPDLFSSDTPSSPV